MLCEPHGYWFAEQSNQRVARKNYREVMINVTLFPYCIRATLSELPPKVGT